MKVKLILLFFIASWVLAACSFFGPSILDIIEDKYEIADTVRSSADPEEVAKIFIADKPLSEVAKTLEKAKRPERVSKVVNDKQVLVYDDYFVTLMPNKDDPNKTDIEVAPYDFVRDNYQPSFFDGLLTYYLLDQLLDTHDWRHRQGWRCQMTGGCYRGYNESGGHYKGPGSIPLFRSTPFRGGGPEEGK